MAARWCYGLMWFSEGAIFVFLFFKRSFFWRLQNLIKTHSSVKWKLIHNCFGIYESYISMIRIRPYRIPQSSVVKWRNSNATGPPLRSRRGVKAFSDKWIVFSFLFALIILDLAHWNRTSLHTIKERGNCDLRGCLKSKFLSNCL